MQKLTFVEVVARYGQVPQRTRLGTALGLLCLVVGLYVYFIEQDQQRVLADAMDTLQKTESTRAEKFAYAANLSLYETRLKELVDTLENARAMLPDSADVPQFLSQIGGIAHEVNLSIVRFEPKEEIAKDFFAETRFSVTARGSYHELGAFLDRVGRMDRIVNVSNLTMEDPKVDHERVVVTGSFELLAYRSMSAEQMAHAQEAERKKDGQP